MKVNVEREVNLELLLRGLDEKSQIKPNGMAGHEVTVSKQLLRDAHDVIAQFMSERPSLKIDLNEGAIYSNGKRIF